MYWKTKIPRVIERQCTFFCWIHYQTLRLRIAWLKFAVMFIGNENFTVKLQCACVSSKFWNSLCGLSISLIAHKGFFAAHLRVKYSDFTSFFVRSWYRRRVMFTLNNFVFFLWFLLFLCLRARVRVYMCVFVEKNLHKRRGPYYVESVGLNLEMNV